MTLRNIRETTTRSKRAMKPLHPIWLITDIGPNLLDLEQILIDSVGYKAFGLSCVPAPWVPPFFVISALCFEKNGVDREVRRWIAECIERQRIRDERIMVRSSGTAETMENRGRLLSTVCSLDKVIPTIDQLINQAQSSSPGRVHWILQQEVVPAQKGHLSNEWRLSREDRDWIVEAEPQGDRLGTVTPLGVRRWRDGHELSDPNLQCSSETAISLCLRRVAIWATRLSSRTHFEWVWNGREIRIVQADVAEPPVGKKPATLLPKNIPSITVDSLSAFHRAFAADFEKYRKLSNARLYQRIGYEMPPFFVMDDQNSIERILSGEIPPAIKSDLHLLTERPLVIRTDGLEIPPDKREMLPRSENLCSVEDAEKWLLNHFRTDVQTSGLAAVRLALIAHHFIPSVACAWARAQPGKRIVRVESLWGVPEGLYWYSHDTFEIDVGENVAISSPSKYPIRARLRYKGTFIAPDAEGKWLPYQTARPHDWARSIRKTEWLYEIARTTRIVAEEEQHEVSVMWFVDNHIQASRHAVLPWYHAKTQLTGSLKAAPRQKRTSAADFQIASLKDWNNLQRDVKSGKRIERVVVKPFDPELIRNPDFATNLAKLAAEQKIVVELSGGVLSHVYYILQREGAQVECTDLFGADEEIVEYNKLVRDRIPEIIKRRGERAEMQQLSSDALLTALRQKLVEEGFEALDARGGEEVIGELADVQEVLIAICNALGIPMNELEAEREEKRQRRGGFDKGIMLVKTAAPQSITKDPEPGSPILTDAQSGAERIISSAAELPPGRSYRRPDLRYAGGQLEKLFTLETEINKLGEQKTAFTFTLPFGDGPERQIVLTVELRRTRASLRTVIRLRLEPPQLGLKFPDSQLQLSFPES